jgi:hypothetical protein
MLRWRWWRRGRDLEQVDFGVVSRSQKHVGTVYGIDTAASADVLLMKVLVVGCP